MNRIYANLSFMLKSGNAETTRMCFEYIDVRGLQEDAMTLATLRLVSKKLPIGPQTLSFGILPCDEIKKLSDSVFTNRVSLPKSKKEIHINELLQQKFSIYDACLCGHGGIVKWLLLVRNVTITETCIMKCIEMNHLHIIIILCTMGIIHKENGNAQFIVEWSSTFGKVAILEYLSSKGFLIQPSDLTCAARNGHLDMVKWLHTRTASVLVSYYAATYGHLKILKWVYKQNPSFTIGTWSGNMIMDIAAAGHLNILKWIRRVYPNMHPWAMIGASYGGHQRIVAWLIGQGCTVCIESTLLVVKSGYFGLLTYMLSTTDHDLHWQHQLCLCAAKNGRVRILVWLLQREIPTLPFLHQLFECSIIGGRVCVVEKLLELYESQITDKVQSNMAILASANGYLHMMIWFVEKCNISTIDNCIFTAADQGHLNIVKYLLTKRDIVDNTEFLLEVFEVGRGYPSICQWLIEKLRKQ